MFFNIFKKNKDNFIKDRDEAIRRIDDLLLIIGDREIPKDMALDVSREVARLHYYLKDFYRINEDKLKILKIDTKESLKKINSCLKDSGWVGNAIMTRYRITKEILPIIREELLSIPDKDLPIETKLSDDKKEVILEINSILDMLKRPEMLSTESEKIYLILRKATDVVDKHYNELKKKGRNPLVLYRNINECEKILRSREFNDCKNFDTIVKCLNTVKVYLK